MLGRLLARRLTRRLLSVLTLLGLFLTCRGYRSREGDQAYRLPLAIASGQPALYADDPFVRAFDAFNPHAGYLTLLRAVGTPAGLSAGMVGLFVLTFFLTCLGIDRLARAVWPELDRRVGLVAASLVVTAQAGNIGTNHLFEPILLDRLVALALGWLAIAAAVRRPTIGAVLGPGLIGLAALVHPSVGLQLALATGVTWVAWGLWASKTGVRPWLAVLAVLALVVCVAPGVAGNLAQSGGLRSGLPDEEYRLLSVELQSPQHMVPHLWRLPQWLAWGCYPLLAALTVGARRRTTDGLESPRATPARTRLVILLGVNLAGLGLAWVGVEGLRSLPLTLFQPFRMATLARGLCLALIAGRLVALWSTGQAWGRTRALLLFAGLLGDWSMVVVTAFELVMTVADRLGGWDERYGNVGRVVGLATLAYGLMFLAKHDTESGYLPLLTAAGVAATLGGRLGRRAWSPRRAAVRLGFAWAVPVAAMVANLAATGHEKGGLTAALVRRCRFAEVPVDDLERLALWCRGHTPADAVFIGPPGPKTFRLWSGRSLAFNRAASPYHARGLGDWARRYRDHVGFQGTNAAFVRAYQRDRHGFEARYDAMPDADKARLARRQGAGYVVTQGPATGSADGPLEFLHAEGRYAVSRVRDDPPLADRRRPGERSVQ